MADVCCICLAVMIWTGLADALFDVRRYDPVTTIVSAFFLPVSLCLAGAFRPAGWASEGMLRDTGAACAGWRSPIPAIAVNDKRAALRSLDAIVGMLRYVLSLIGT
ncbi:hypothetical protein AA21291_0099 [Swaminathania salitolerans LMG 21291]|uniref:Uncharacterized protein n=1 Tax=Swaminathania salitolerans TaxID=182838 RepID=A0A511BMR9_9PROT|nr:hypothetical protein AA21291_0099 [Swaminathania salitolerans LMG 21291]GEL00944.1 hypothetical protein SSA02_01070 [Swaminathania salitolerans]